MDALSVRWNLGSSTRSKLWGRCDSPVDSSMCAGPSTFSSTGVGRIVQPRDFIGECMHKEFNRAYHFGTSDCKLIFAAEQLTTIRVKFSLLY